MCSTRTLAAPTPHGGAQRRAAQQAPRFYVEPAVLRTAAAGSVFQLDALETHHALRCVLPGRLWQWIECPERSCWVPASPSFAASGP